MTLLLSAESISKSYSAKALFHDVSLHLFNDDKIGLIGPNGSGKSTFLKILCDIENPDEGKVTMRRNLKIGYVPQMVTYHQETPAEVLLSTLANEKHLDDHERYTNMMITLGKAGFENNDIPIKILSGGWKKRLDVANALVLNPDILLLDEPTNHLDIKGILWLESFLRRTNFPYIVISHDRNFLETVSSRIIELNPCYPNGTFSINGSYSDFLEKKEDFLQGQQTQQAALSSKVRREIDWLRQTPQARTTKSRSRIQNANNLITDLSIIKKRNNSAARAQIEFSSTGRKTKKLLVAKNISKTFQNKCLFPDFTLTITPGMRIAVVGDNGTGKTTLMKTLAGELSPDTGTIEYAEKLRIVYFDQHREKLPEDITVREALADGNDTVMFRVRNIHVAGWAASFLFTSDRLDMPVSHLSGGEKARILIARLMTKPADILFLDEPTNDLDILTLEILEENLREFPGAVIFITHDRYMLNDLATIFVGLGNDANNYLFADYYQWEKSLNEQEKKETTPTETKRTAKPKSPPKLSYNEKKELGKIEAKILSLENKVEALQQCLEDPNLTTDNEKLQQKCLELKNAQDKVEALYMRWEELEEKQ
jgi:ABC transport system ATP-binding/permease protein